MTKRRCILVSFLALGAAALFLILATFSATATPQLPDWLANVKPAREARVEADGSGFQIEGARRLKMSLAELTDKLDRDLVEVRGWKRTNTLPAIPRWACNTDSDIQILWADSRPDGVVVYTSWEHTPTWLEKTQVTIKRLIGAKI